MQLEALRDKLNTKLKDIEVKLDSEFESSMKSIFKAMNY